jgi:hypothetical protein
MGCMGTRPALVQRPRGYGFLGFRYRNGLSAFEISLEAIIELTASRGFPSRKRRSRILLCKETRQVINVKSLAIPVLALILFCAPKIRAQVPFEQTAYKATAILYGEDTSGSMHMKCTTTAYAKVPNGYLFVTASHCVSNQDTAPDGGEKLSKLQNVQPVKLMPDENYISFDEVGDKQFMAAEVVAAGVQEEGNDFSILYVKTLRDISTISIGDESREVIGNPVINIAAPEGLGRQLMHGYISMPKMDRPVKQGSINWSGAMILQIGAGPGSSGSAILSLKQSAIVGFLVGTVDGNNVIAIPASRFKAWSNLVRDKKYPAWPASMIPKDAPSLPQE